MTKEEYLKILKDSFKDFVFYEDGHYYECKGKKVGISVTTFIHEFCNEFDAEGMAEKVANRDGKTIQQVLDEWAYKRDFSCEKGSLGHLYAQGLWNGEDIKDHAVTNDKTRIRVVLSSDDACSILTRYCYVSLIHAVFDGDGSTCVLT